MNQKLSTITRCLSLFAFLLSANLLMAQSQTTLDIALRHIEENHKIWNLSTEDVTDIVVSDSHVSNISGTTHIYFQQRHEGINIYNAILNVSISDDGEVIFAGKRFIADVAAKTAHTSPSIDMETALASALSLLDITAPEYFSAKETKKNAVVFDKGTFAKRDITVKLTYVLNKEGNLSLAWDMDINPSGDLDYWQIQLDAVTGELINKTNLLIKCQHTGDLGHRHTSTCNDQIEAEAATTAIKETPIKEALASTNTVLVNTYRAFVIPTESPTHGPHELVANPEDMNVSPLGWHDNGTSQWTITRGNNSHAFLDNNADDAPDLPEPDGGATLDFDFPFDPSLEPADIADASQVNLFYMSNIMHDFSYHYGFDEAAGNFQDNNFGNGGFANDHINMHAQYGSTTGQLDNAFYSPTPDGASPMVAMFVWAANNGTGLVTVTEPSSIAGIYLTGTADFGPPVDETPICGEVVIVNDGVYDPYFTDGCEEEFINGDDLDGKIAIIDRGGCFFQDKALHAQAYGAIGVIICNFEDATINMGAGGTGAAPTIPSVMINSTDCQTIRQFAGNGLEICLVQPTQTGPDQTDGDLDNGIIAHEIGHGISGRMTGGGSNIGCLSNAEQMGEGWSDWFGLVTTVKPGDTGETARGIGNYAVKLPANGKGIRRYPYSTDMNVSPLTYSDVALNTGVHAIGEVWCNMIWDLYWAMVDYDPNGWDADLYYGDGGNNKAMKLVMEGIKTQQCEPGFVSGRDAIIAADQALYNGEHECLIWDVFARRGCGFYADEGDTNSAGDQIESFESLPTCIPELKIKKSVTSLINAGDNIEVTVTVINHRKDGNTELDLTGVVVNDDLMDGTSYIDGSVSSNISNTTVNGNVVTFTIGDMAYEEETTFTYELATTTDLFSIRREFDDIEYDTDSSIAWWVSAPIVGANLFELSEDAPYEGDQSWFLQDIDAESQHQLLSTKTFTVDGDRPVIRFYSQYNLEAGADGGLFEISTDEGQTYQQLGEHMIRNGYPGGIQYATFVIPNLSAFSGNSNGYKATYVDLSDYDVDPTADDNVTFRFHFASDDNTFAGGGWHIDNFEYMDMKNYNSTTCATSDQGDSACAEADEEGTIVESQIATSVVNPEATVQLGVYPNPADDLINVTVSSKHAQNVNISVVTLDGKVVNSKEIGTTQNTETFPINVGSLPAGFYFVKAATNNEVIVQKVVIK